jgi:hypothetical protein
MDNPQILLQLVLVLLGPIMGVFGYMLRRAFMKLDLTMTDIEVRTLINDRLDPMRTNQRNIEHEINRIERKLDKILDLLLEAHKHDKS